MVTVCVPSGAAAAPVLLNSLTPDLGCAGIVIKTENCSRFGADPLSDTPLELQFSLLEDVALLEFTLATNTSLSVSTIPFWEDATGPFFGVFNALELDADGNRVEGSLEVASFTDSSGATIRVLQDVLDPPNPDLPVVLGPGSYLLALIAPGNFFNSDPSSIDNRESLAFGFSQDFVATACPDDLAGCAFSITFHASAEDGGPAPVPEPGTLTLMAGGAIAGLIHRRRSKKRNRPEPVWR
jgi:hypothetical protein